MATHTYIFFLGREPQLSEAELKAALRITDQPEPTRSGRVAVLKTDKNIPNNFIDRLGGTDRIAEQVGQFLAIPSPGQVIEALSPTPKKWTVGISAVLQSQKLNLKAFGLDLKKQARAQESRLSFVTPTGKRMQLNAAQVMFNKLDQEPNAELTLLEQDGQILLLKTAQVQDIAAYEKRDTARPARDPKSGMLPPKLAQMMLNIALGEYSREASTSGGSPVGSPADSQQARPRRADAIARGKAGVTGPDEIHILDPFCGSGTVLQEGWLMDCRMTGTDASEAAIRASKRNLASLNTHFRLEPNLVPELTQHDATKPFPRQWHNSFSAAVTEPFLGPPVKAPLSPAVAERRLADLAALYRATFQNIHPSLKTGGAVAFLFPIFFTRGGWFGIPQNVIDGLEKIGYRVVQLNGTVRGITYKRPDALVARELILFKKL